MNRHLMYTCVIIAYSHMLTCTHSYFPLFSFKNLVENQYTEDL